MKPPLPDVGRDLRSHCGDLNRNAIATRDPRDNDKKGGRGKDARAAEFEVVKYAVVIALVQTRPRCLCHMCRAPSQPDLSRRNSSLPRLQ